jgi:uncharacterized repeat protein (TIGR02543 family)
VAQFKIQVGNDVNAATAMTLGLTSGTTNQVSLYPTVTSYADVGETTMTIGTLSQVKVTWNLDGGKINGNGNSIEQDVTYGTAATKPSPDPVKDGYDFDGWYLASDESESVIGSFPSLTADTEYKAKWTAKSYKITYENLDGGTNATDARTTYTILDGALPEPDKPGYTFAGWQITAVGTETSLTANDGKTYTSLAGNYGDVTLKATWTIDASAANVEYQYAGGAMNGTMLIVSAVPGSGDTVYYNNVKLYHIAAADATSYTAMFGTEQNPVATFNGANGVYVTLITGSYDASLLTFAEGGTEELTFSKDINGDGTVNAFDAVILYQLVNNRNNMSATDIGIKARLLADVDHSFTADATDLGAIVDAFGTSG